MPAVNKGKTLALNASAAAATTAGETRRNWPSAVAGRLCRRGRDIY